MRDACEQSTQQRFGQISLDPALSRASHLFWFETFERALPKQPFRRDVSGFDLGHKRRLDPDGDGFFDRQGKFGFRAHNSIELFSDLA